MTKSEQLEIFIPEDLKQEKRSTTNLTKDGYILNAQVFLQGGRIVYRTTLSFSDVKMFLRHTKEKPSNHNEMIEDVNTLRNRYLKPSKAKELKAYILEQPYDFILPGITVMVDKALPFKSIIPDYEELNSTFHDNDDPDLYHTPEMVKEAIDRYKQPLFGQIVLPVKENGELAVELDTGDGNHRTKAIHDIVELTEAEKSSYYIGCDFYVEPNIEKRKEMFVDLNNGTPIDRSTYNILKGNDPLSIATKQIAGIDDDSHVVQHLKNNYTGYIGFSPVDDIASKSKVTVSFNVLKNIISYIALNRGDGSNTGKKFKENFPAYKSNYESLLSFTSKYLRAIFNNVPPFSRIKGDLESIPDLRTKYASMNAAGLYVIAKIGHIGFVNHLNPEKLAEKMATINWRKEISEGIFAGGILGANGRVSNTHTAIDTSTERVLKEIGIVR